MSASLIFKWQAFIVLFCFHAALSAQNFNDVAFSMGSYDKVTKEIRTVQAGEIWIVTDMDEGTNFTLVKKDCGLSVSKHDGIIWIQTINLNDPSTNMMLIGALEFKIPGKAHVQFTCDRGQFIYLYNRMK